MRPHQREVAAYLESIGATGIRIEPARSLGHPRLVFEYGGREWRTVIAGTPSCAFSVRKKIADLQRLLGLRDNDRHVGERRARKQRRHHPPAPSDLPRATRFTATYGLSPLNTPFADLPERLSAAWPEYWGTDAAWNEREAEA